jgi:hypothetical protein
MLWTYMRDGKQSQVEVRRALDGPGFELRHRDAQGREVIETFTSLDRLNRRVESIERRLAGDGWSLAGALRS